MTALHPDKAIRHARRNRQFWHDVNEVLDAAQARGLRSIDIHSLRLLQDQALQLPKVLDPNPPRQADQTHDGYDVVTDKAD